MLWRNVWMWCWLIVLGLSACSDNAVTGSPTPPPDPKTVLAQAVDALQAVNTFRMIIEQSGAPYSFGVSLDAGQTVVSAVMRRGEAQYITPNRLGAQITLRIGGLPSINVNIFAEGADQWFSLVGSGWIQYPIAEGFDPGKLVAEDSGFSVALSELRELQTLDEVTLVDGTRALHIRGLAEGQTINELLFDLLDITQNNVQVDVYLNPETKMPVLLEVLIPDTATANESDTVWRIEVFDVNGPIEIDLPEGVNL